MWFLLMQLTFIICKIINHIFFAIQNFKKELDYNDYDDFFDDPNYFFSRNEGSTFYFLRKKINYIKIKPSEYDDLYPRSFLKYKNLYPRSFSNSDSETEQ